MCIQNIKIEDCGNTTAVQFLRSLTVLDLTESRDYKHSPKSKRTRGAFL